MTGRFDRPGLLAAVTRAAVLDGTAPVIRNAVTHATTRRVAASRGSERDGGRATDHPAGGRPSRRRGV